MNVQLSGCQPRNYWKPVVYQEIRPSRRCEVDVYIRYAVP